MTQFLLKNQNAMINFINKKFDNMLVILIYKKNSCKQFHAIKDLLKNHSPTPPISFFVGRYPHQITDVPLSLLIRTLRLNN